MQDPFPSIKDWFKRQPIVSKTYLVVNLLVAILYTAQVISPKDFAFTDTSISNNEPYQAFTALLGHRPIFIISVPETEFTFLSIGNTIISILSQFLFFVIYGFIFVYPATLHLIYIVMSSTEEYLKRDYLKTEGIIMIVFFWSSFLIYATFLGQMPFFLEPLAIGLAYVWSSRLSKNKVDCLFLGEISVWSYFYFFTLFLMIMNKSVQKELYAMLMGQIYRLFRDVGFVLWVKEKYQTLKYIFCYRPRNNAQ